MNLGLPRENAAQAILDGLRAADAIETPRPEALVVEIATRLGAYEAELEAIVDEVRAAAPRAAGAWAEIGRRALARGTPIDEAALPGLDQALGALLLASEHVEEIFLDDDALSRIIQAALRDYLPAVAAALEERFHPEAGKPRERAAPPAPPTLADEGFPFPLFEAQRKDASLDEAGRCSACAAAAETRFNKVCYACFRAGKAPLTMGTELGMVRPEDAAAGLTHGVPAGVVPKGAVGGEEEAGEEDEAWVRFRVPAEHLVELTRTPQYATWQGESWLFCCGAPMIFTGSLDARALDALQAEGRPLEQVVSSLLDEQLDEDDELIERLLRGNVSMYTFRCPRCDRRRAHWDQD